MTDINEIKSKITPILKAAGARRASIFGSYARGQQNEKSDVDILIELPEGLSLFDFIEIQQNLEAALRKKVDLVEYKAIKPLLKKYILKDVMPVL